MSDIVTIKDGSFCFGEKPFRFIGANMYELAYTSTETAERMLQSAAAEGFSVIRFWTFASMQLERFEAICRIAEHLQIRLIPVLGDMNEFLQGFRVNDKFFESEYSEKYLPFAENMAARFGNFPQIMLWEIFNEPAVSDFDLIYKFTETVCSSLKNAGALQPVSMGTIGGIGDKFGSEFSRFKHDNFRKLIAINCLDAVSLHDYSFCSSLLERADLYFRLKAKYKSSARINRFDNVVNKLPDAIDEYLIKQFGRTLDFPLTLRSIWRMYNDFCIANAKALGKPVYVGELGIKKRFEKLRTKVLEMELRRNFDSGVSGILLWSFEAEGKSLDGHDYGFDENDQFGKVSESVLKDVMNTDS